jgi:GT2 family glycosyltransferase
VDADTHPSYALFAALMRTLRGGGVIGGGATLEMDEPEPVAGMFVALWNGLSRALRLAAGSFVFCEAAAFRAVGGFSEQLFASEELDFSKRLRRFGRPSGRQMVILHEHPLVTSARKLKLYSRGAHARFFLAALLRPNRTLKRREACTLWYDGRR